MFPGLLGIVLCPAVLCNQQPLELARPSTGEGKPKVQDEKATTVYKRALDVEYQLKVGGWRLVFFTGQDSVQELSLDGW